MTYEEYLDEVTTLIFEKFGVSEAAAIKLVMAAQNKEFFVRHDDDKNLRNVDQAHKDAKAIFDAAQSKKPAVKSRPK
ncbi:hypothetical protein ACHMW6_16560 [Pseudoduganella sp. UC29_106]|uniref:hypothetical protein n=1 Tax=Pseudoduganella sp. UC29_106 TaxID=3374553 RepID=UPI0037581A79